MDEFIRFAVLGLSTGGLYALLGLGIIVGFRSSGVINFAHGAVALVAAYVYYDLTLRGHGAPVAVAGGVLASVLCSLAIYFLVIKPLGTASPLTKGIATLAVLVVAQSTITLKYGSSPLIATPFLPQDQVSVLGTITTVDNLIILGLCLILSAVLHVVYRKTKFGLATTGLSESEFVFALLGRSVTVVAGANELGVPRAHLLDDIHGLAAVRRAGHVRDHTTGTHRRERGPQQGRLQRMQRLHVVGAVPPPGLRPSAQGAQAGAGDVGQDPAEGAGTPSRPGTVGDHDPTRERVAADSGLHQSGPVRCDLGGQHPLPAFRRQAGRQGGLAARSRAEVQPPAGRGRQPGQPPGGELRPLVLHADPTVADHGEIAWVSGPGRGEGRVPARFGSGGEQVGHPGQSGTHRQRDRRGHVVGQQRRFQFGRRQHVGQRRDHPRRVRGRDGQPVGLSDPRVSSATHSSQLRAAIRRRTALTSPVTRSPTVAAARSTVAATAACAGVASWSSECAPRRTRSTTAGCSEASGRPAAAEMIRS